MGKIYFNIMKEKWKRIGNHNINEPLYNKHLEKSILKDKEIFDVKYENKQIYNKHLERIQLLITKINACKSFDNFQTEIITILEEQKSEEIPILYLHGKEYQKSINRYFALLLIAQEYFSYKEDIQNKDKIDNFLNSKIQDIQKKYNFDKEELDAIKAGRSYTKYAIKMNQLIRILNLYYAKILDDGTNRKKYIKLIEEFFDQNPEIDNFVNSTLLSIEKENKEKNEEKIEDLKISRIFLYDKLIKEIKKSDRTESEKEIDINRIMKLKDMW